MKNKAMNDKIDNFYDVYFKIYGLVLFFAVVTCLLVFNKNPEVQIAVIRMGLSFLFVIASMGIVNLVLFSKQVITSLFFTTSIIVIVGVVFFKLWPLESYSSLFMSIPICFLIVIFFKSLLSLIKTSPMGVMQDKINHANELSGYRVKIKSFTKIIVVEMWILLLGTISYILEDMYGVGEFPTLLVSLFFIFCWMAFSYFNFAIMSVTTKKIKKSASSVIGFVIITPIVVPMLVIYFLKLLSISVKLIG